MNVAILATISSGVDVTNIVTGSTDVCAVIGLSSAANTENVSGYVDFAPICAEKGIPFIEIDDYSLKSQSDKAKLQELEIDILLVAGWQRLIPQWLIEQCRICAVGVHGSPYGITGGRGRSPQNWAMILGKDEFHLSIFEITPGIDDGAIIKSSSFEISDFDTIATTHHKVAQLTAYMFLESLQDNSFQNREFAAQNGEARYLPIRRPEDGEIDWSLPSKMIYDFVRGQTDPYPGAHTFLQGQKISILQSSLYRIDHQYDHKPGTIVMAFHNGDLLVKTGDGTLLVIGYRTDQQNISFKNFDSFESADSKEQYERIISRHTSRYPNLELAEDILKLS